jgi:hypothetical protein
MRISFVPREWSALSWPQQRMLKLLNDQPVPMPFKHPKKQTAEALVRRGYVEHYSNGIDTGYRITRDGIDLIKVDEDAQKSAHRLMSAMRQGMKERGELG